MEGEGRENTKTISRCEVSLCRGKGVYGFENNRRGAIPSPHFDVAGAGMSMGLEGVKKVETGEEGEGVSYS